MTDPAHSNTASGDATVGVQANVIHGDVHHYEVAPDASPEEFFEVGVRLLEARSRAEARAHMEKAAARGLVNDQVQFYRLMALLSGQTLRQLANPDLDSLGSICARLGQLAGNGEWTAGLRAVLALLSTLPATDGARVDKELDALAPTQRNLILDHLSRLLEGPAEDEMWRRSVGLARERRTSEGRSDRVWKFFQPVPAGPRVGAARPSTYEARDLLKAGLGVFVALFCAGRVAQGLLGQRAVVPIIAFLVVVAGGVFFVRHGAEWHFRRGRIRAKDAELMAGERCLDAPPYGFARAVDGLFEHYFGRYRPDDVDRATWLLSTAGIRQRLRDELVDIYREQRVHAQQIAWLVRYLAYDARRRREQGTVLSYRAELRTPVRDKAVCVTGLAALILGALVILGDTTAGGVGWTLLAAVAGTVTVRAGFRLDSERRRFGADAAEIAVELGERQQAYERWTQKLSDRPSDPQMAEWLEADRRVIVDSAMRHYLLDASQIIAHAVVEGPAPGARSARVKHGPKRYSRYQMVVFLLTTDGVRQIDVHLDFESATGQITQRHNYRFDAVTSVRISGIATQRQVFELTLTNGLAIRMAVTEATGEIEPGEDPARLSQVSLDASGLPLTLHVLEGIAAEGKEWAHHQRRRTDQRLTELATAARDLLSET